MRSKVSTQFFPCIFCHSNLLHKRSLDAQQSTVTTKLNYDNCWNFPIAQRSANQIHATDYHLKLGTDFSKQKNAWFISGQPECRNVGESGVLFLPTPCPYMETTSKPLHFCSLFWLKIRVVPFARLIFYYIWNILFWFVLTFHLNY